MRVAAMASMSCFLLGIAAPGYALQARQEDRVEPLTQRLIVKFNDSRVQAATLTAQDRVVLLARRGNVALTHIRTMALGAHVVALDHPVSLSEANDIARSLAGDSDVEYVEPDRRLKALFVPNDAFITSELYLADDAFDISAFSAWDITTGSANTVVAVVDTGSGTHQGLAGRFVPGYDFVSEVDVANDGDGRDPDATDPGDWISATDAAGVFSGCEVTSSTWHGQAVAGIIAANGNDKIWTAGIDWGARILPVRVLGKCGGFDSDISDGIAWAAGLSVPDVPANPSPAQIINLSLGGQGTCSITEQTAISAALAHGVTKAIVVAAGNDAVDVANANPANCDGVIAVAATSTAGSKTNYTNFGAGIAISAPGGNNKPRNGAITGYLVLVDNGTTVPHGSGTSYYSGTSLSAPIVSGVVSLMLSVAPNLSADQVRSVLTSTAKPFPSGSTCTTATCGAGIVDAFTAVQAAQALAAATPVNYEGLWWNSPGGSEAGWGINFAHQGDLIFASWFTYDLTGKGTWLVMTASKTAPNTYTGTLFQGTGPSFDAAPFPPLGSPGGATVSGLTGTGTITFSDANNATFAYTLGGISQSKAITRQLFGPQPVCTFGAQANLALATNYTDLWWASPGGSEAGWGINLTHQGDIIFATWFTFDRDHTPMWLVVQATKTAPGTYAGTQVYRLSGPAFDAVPFPPIGATGGPTGVVVGAATFTFADGNAATFNYTVEGVTQTKAITREVFTSPGTVCH